METCKSCGKKFKAFWISEHETYCARKLAEKAAAKKRKKEEDLLKKLSTQPGSAKRQAAAKYVYIVGFY